MRSLIWGFAGRAYHIVGNPMHWLHYKSVWFLIGLRSDKDITVVPTKSDSDVGLIVCLQLLSKAFYLYTSFELTQIDGSLVY